MDRADTIFFGAVGAAISLLVIFVVIVCLEVMVVDCLEFFGYQRKTVQPIVRILAVIVFALVSIALLSKGR